MVEMKKLSFQKITRQRECLKLGWNLQDITKLLDGVADAALTMQWLTFCDHHPKNERYRSWVSVDPDVLDMYHIIHHGKNLSALDWDHPVIANSHIEYTLTEQWLKESPVNGPLFNISMVMHQPRISDSIWERHRTFIHRWAAVGIRLDTIEKKYRQTVSESEVYDYIRHMKMVTPGIGVYLDKYHIPLAILGPYRASAINKETAHLWKGVPLLPKEQELLLNAFEEKMFPFLMPTSMIFNPYLHVQKRNHIDKVSTSRPISWLTWKEHILAIDFSHVTMTHSSMNKDWIYLCEWAAQHEKDPSWLYGWTAKQLKEVVDMTQWACQDWITVNAWITDGNNVTYQEYMQQNPIIEGDIYL